MYAPIIVFAFNRLEALEATIQSLLRNEEAKDCELYIFVDGARSDKKGESEKVLAVQEYVKSITGFKCLEYTFSKSNKGLGTSIINGVSQIINKAGKAIVLEDDLIVSGNFLSFMNQALNRYEHESSVFSICGYSNWVRVPSRYVADAYFCTRSSSWGWATWKNRWDTVDWELKDWDKYSNCAQDFNRWGGSDCWSMLEGWRNGKNRSWAIRFCFSQFLQNRLSLFPVISKVKNDGFDGQGTNCKKWSRFKSVFDDKEWKDFVFPDDITITKTIYRSAMWYHSIPLRIWSKLMYLIYR